MTEQEIRELKGKLKELSDGLREMGRDMVDPSVPKTQKFLVWLAFDQLVVNANNTFQKALDNIEPEEA